MADWFEYSSPSTRLDDWLLHLANTFSSSRIGEYIESSCRLGSGRGLHYRDMKFGVFLNEYGHPEFAVQLTRDAKNSAERPDRRPQHPLYEGAVPILLCFNPMLPFLARLLVHQAFRDYNTVEALLNIMPPEGEMLQLHWRRELLDTPFFKSQSSRISEQKIETAAAFSKRLRALGLRAGFAKPPTVHDWRAEGLYWVDKFYSEATRMVHAGHTDPNTLSRHYMPTNGADGQDTYMGGKGRPLVGDLFRGLTVVRNPNLWQCLPAEQQHELENKPEYRQLKQEIATLQRKTDKESADRRQKLYAEKRRITNKELRSWQRYQSDSQSDPLGYHRAILDRVEFMMPERKSLRYDLFQIDTLRSPTGLNALSAMVKMYQKQSEVEYRPGLEPQKCCCLKQDGPTPDVAHWKHIYTCYKRSREDIHGFAELCFLCSKWFTESASWEDHCQEHLNNLATFPVFCDPLTYGGVLATPGFCPFCLTQETLPASVRLHQFKNRAHWLEHIQKHVSLLDADKPIRCPHPQPYCAKSFDSVMLLQFHLQDAHGIDFITERLKRNRDEDEESLPRKRRLFDRQTQADIKNEASVWVFINTSATRSDRKPSSIETSSGCSTPLHVPESAVIEDVKPRLCSEGLVIPAFSPEVVESGLDIESKTETTLRRNPRLLTCFSDNPIPLDDDETADTHKVAELVDRCDPSSTLPGVSTEPGTGELAISPDDGTTLARPRRTTRETWKAKEAREGLEIMRT